MRLNTLSFIIHLIWIALFTSCSSDDAMNNDAYVDSFTNGVVESFTKIDVDINVFPVTVSIFQPGLLLLPNECEAIIIGDNLDKTFSVLNREGHLLSKVGGEGGGPGEFRSVMWAHIGSDQNLYVIDGLQFRISKYSFENGNLIYKDSFSYRNQTNHFLSSVYITEFGKYGLYQESEGYMHPESRFLLYRLDDDFSPSELLLTIPGHQRQKFETPNFVFYMPFKYRSHMEWYLDDEWFYYLSTDSTDLFRYNIRSKESEVIDFLQLEERYNTPHFTASVKEYYSNAEDEDYWSVLDEIDGIPFFEGLLVKDEFIYLTLLPTPGLEGMTLVLNMETKEVKYIRSPQEFFPRGICDDIIYGIDFRMDDAFQVMSAKMHLDE